LFADSDILYKLIFLSILYLVFALLFSQVSRNMVKTLFLLGLVCLVVAGVLFAYETLPPETVDEWRTHLPPWLFSSWVMAPLALCSLVTVVLTLERLWTVSRGWLGLTPDVIDRVMAARTKSDPRQVEAACRPREKRPFARLLLAATQRAGSPRPDIDAAVDAARLREMDRVHIPTTWLGFVGTVAPLLGLLGTVLGMWAVFGDMKQSGENQGTVLSGGINEAMATTIVGLFIAIPAKFLEHLFTVKLRILDGDMDTALKAFTAALPTPPAERRMPVNGEQPQANGRHLPAEPVSAEL
jgi:biopolymer transport protein ExbB